MAKSLQKQLLNGSFWIILLELGNQALQFFKTFYAAKILSPGDFGIVGFAFLIIAFLEILSTTGMKEAVIQKQDDVTSYLDTIWTIELVKGVVVFVLMYFLSTFIVPIFHPQNTQLTIQVIRFIGLIFFIQCSTNVGVLFFEKNIEFKKFFKFQISGTIADVLVSLAFVYYLQNVWGLFFGVLAGNLMKVLFSFVLSDYKPKLHVNRRKAKELYSYGKWVFGSRVFGFVGLQADSIIVSSFYGLHSLGIYQMAFRIGNLPMSQVSNLIGRIAFPTFSKLSQDKERLKQYFLTSFSLLIILLMPIVILVFGFIRDFTVLFLGTKWISIVPIVKVLILSGLLRIFVSLIDSLFMAIGESKYSSFIQSGRFFVFAILALPCGYIWGITGIALSALLSLAIIFIYFLKVVSIRLDIKFGEVKENILLPVVFGTIMIGLLYFTKNIYYKQSITFFVLFILLTVITYALAGLALNKYTELKFFAKPISIFKSFVVLK